MPSNRYNELSCDRSLTYGDIGFGDDELNWICKVRIEND